MKNLNKVMLIGNLAKDPEVKQAGNSTVAEFSIATNSKFKKGEEWVEKTEFHNIKAWGKLADVCEKYLKKGSPVYVEGRIETQSWEKDGVKKYRTEIIISDLNMLPSGKAEAKPDEEIPF
jgi:single-strand DNA-binding protein